MHTKLSQKQFGPWALITGASSGIGKEFAVQLATQGFNLVLVARRAPLLQTLAAELETKYVIRTRAVDLDLAEDNFLARLRFVTDSLEIGLVISNAGIANAGEFLKMEWETLRKSVRINVLAHLAIARHFGENMTKLGRGGIILVSANGSSDGVPFLANSAATKAYVHSLGQGLHIEFKRSGVTVLVMSPGATDTAAMGDLGFKPGQSPIKPMAVGPCVAETLRALKAGRSHIIPGRLNRIMSALVPASVGRNLFGKMLAKANGITLALLLVTKLHAQDSLRLSLDEAIKLGLANNKSIQAAALNSDLDEYQAKQARAALYPSIAGNVSLTHYFDVPAQYVAANTLNPSAPSHEYTGLKLLLPNSLAAGVTVNWTFYKQAVFAGLKIIQLRDVRTSIQFQKDRSELAFAISQLYYGISFTGKQQENLKKILGNQDRLLALLQANVDNGLVLRTELEKVKVNKETTRSQLDELSTAVEAQDNILKLLIGAPPQTRLSLSIPDVDRALSPITDTMMNPESSYDFQLLRTQRQLTGLERKAIMATNMPTLGFTYGYSYNAVSPDFGKIFGSGFSFPVQYAGLNLAVPIFNGNGNVFRLRENAVRSRQEQLQADQLLQKIGTDIVNARLRYNSSLDRLHANHANVQLAQDLYKQSLEQYHQGTILLTDVLTFETTLEQALSQYLSSVSNSLMALLDYKKATNTIL